MDISILDTILEYKIKKHHVEQFLAIKKLLFEEFYKLNDQVNTFKRNKVDNKLINEYVYMVSPVFIEVITTLKQLHDEFKTNEKLPVPINFTKIKTLLKEYNEPVRHV